MLTRLQSSQIRTAYHVSHIRARDLTAHQRRQWQDLQQRALEPNPFISPLFVLPALKHLTPRTNLHAIQIHRRTDTGNDLVGFGLFEFRWASRLLPLPHMRAYQTPGNGFLTGLLVDEEHAEEVLTQFFEFTSHQESHWQHLEFDLRSTDGRFSVLLDGAAREFGKTWHGHSFERPVICPQDVDGCDPESYLSKNRRKKYRRATRDLQAMGHIEFRVLREESELSRAGTTFLQMEDQGWKHTSNQSFRSIPRTERFFREMTENFSREQQIFYSELRLNQRTIGSTINLLAGNQGFAFKSGWADDLEDVGIGALQEIELVKHAPQYLSDLTSVDGCTGGQSWLASLWPGTRCMGSGVFTGSHLADRIARLALPTVRAPKE